MAIGDIKDFDKYYTIQIWSTTDKSGISLEPLVKKIENEIILKNCAKIIDTEGPTPFLPDFFSELYGSCLGYLIQVKKDINPYDLKRTCMNLENDSLGNRMCDIDIYTSMRDSIHRRDLDK